MDLDGKFRRLIIITSLMLLAIIYFSWSTIAHNRAIEKQIAYTELQLKNIKSKHEFEKAKNNILNCKTSYCIDNISELERKKIFIQVAKKKGLDNFIE